MADTPPRPRPVHATVTDNRPVPRGVLPRGVQTWIMAGIAVGMLAIMLLVGRSDPPVRTTSAPAAAQVPSTDRVRDYQERLRAMEAQALREAQAAAVTPAPAMTGFQEQPSAPAPDPLEADRKRREYESLFASNVVLSRRPEGERPDAGRDAAATRRRHEDRTRRCPLSTKSQTRRCARRRGPPVEQSRRRRSRRRRAPSRRLRERSSAALATPDRTERHQSRRATASPARGNGH